MHQSGPILTFLLPHLLVSSVHLLPPFYTASSIHCNLSLPKSIPSTELQNNRQFAVLGEKRAETDPAYAFDLHFFAGTPKFTLSTYRFLVSWAKPNTACIPASSWREGSFGSNCHRNAAGVAEIRPKFIEVWKIRSKLNVKTKALEHAGSIPPLGRHWGGRHGSGRPCMGRRWGGRHGSGRPWRGQRCGGPRRGRGGRTWRGAALGRTGRAAAGGRGALMMTPGQLVAWCGGKEGKKHEKSLTSGSFDGTFHFTVYFCRLCSARRNF
jgi:hypothetical protein